MTTVVSQTSPPKSCNHVNTAEQSPGNQTGNEPVPFFSWWKKCPTDIKESAEHTTTTFTGDTIIPLLTITTSLIEETMARNQQTNELYLPLTSTVVLKRKQEMLYVPLDLDDNLTVDALVDSGVYVSAIAQNELDTIKQKARRKLLKIDDRPNFQIQLPDG